MTAMTRSIILIVSLAVVPAAGALAQNTQSSDQTTPSAQNPNTPGATGRTIVKGDNSTIHGDRRGTREEKTGEISGK